MGRNDPARPVRPTRAPASCRLAAAAGLLLALASVAGCSHRARVEHVTIANMAFSPARIAASPGDTVIWDNRDIVPHTATSVAGKWDTGNIGPDSSARIVVPPGGLGPYRCTYHANMTGSLDRR